MKRVALCDGSVVVQLTLPIYPILKVEGQATIISKTCMCASQNVINPLTPKGESAKHVVGCCSYS